MYKKKHLVITAVCTAVAVWALCCVYFLGFGGPTSGDAVARARKIISENYVNPLTEEQEARMTDLAINGMVYGLGDQYSAYFNAEDLAAYQEEQKEHYKGIGIHVNFDAETNIMTVISPFDGSPAQKAGVLPGDVLVKIGNMEVSAETYEDLINYIRDGEDENILLTIRRGEEILELSVQREEIKEQSITHKMFAEGIGYIRISEFLHNTEADFEAALNDLKEKNVQALIIDLRSNPGGYADTVLAMTDLLLPKGVIAYLEDSHGKREYFYSDADCVELPMTVLINRGTASASELMAGSLKAHGLATVIGEKSYGKAVGQAIYPLTATTALRLTSARYFTPNGECIDKVGIEPDICVALPEELLSKISFLEPEEDPQLNKAMEVLRGLK